MVSQRSQRMRKLLSASFDNESATNDERPSAYVSTAALIKADFGKLPSKNIAFPLANIIQMNPEIEEKRKSTIAASFAYTMILRSDYLGSITGPDPKRAIEKEEDYASTTGHETAHILQNHFNRCANWVQMITPEAFAALDEVKRSHDLTEEQERLNEYTMQKWGKRVDTYFARDCEIQARMHEILAWSYQSLQQLPSSKLELFALLHNTGLRTPQTIIDELYQSKEGQKALSDFTLQNEPFSHLQLDIANINIVIDFAPAEELKQALWNDLFTSLYANLTEIYGMPEGRQMMGLGESKTAALQLSSLNHLCQSRSDISDINIETSIDLATQLCRQISAQDGANFIMTRDPIDEIKALLEARDDIQAVLKQNPKPIYYNRYLETPQAF